MTSKNYVVINGRAYNTITGMVMDDIDVKKTEVKKVQPINNRGTAVSNIHANHIQKSSTLTARPRLIRSFVVLKTEILALMANYEKIVDR